MVVIKLDPGVVSFSVIFFSLVIAWQIQAACKGCLVRMAATEIACRAALNRDSERTSRRLQRGWRANWK
jgi:hypothetical protein